MRLTIILSLLVTTPGLAACGSSGPNPDGPTSSPGSTAPRAPQATSFARCMRSHGVTNFPDPTGGRLELQVQRTPNSTSVNGVEVNGPAFQSAMQACRPHLPKGGPP